jgi:hypothetical protein
MDRVSQIIGRSVVEFDGELIAYEAQPNGHQVIFLFPDVISYNRWWQSSTYIQKCWDKDLVVEHFIPYDDDHDPVKRIATQLYASMKEMEIKYGD